MRFSNVIAASLVVPFVAAHGGVHVPKIVGLGGSKVANFKSRNVHGHATRAVRTKRGAKLNARQGGVDGRCGPEGAGASCDEGYCCSPEGWCGTGPDYCMAPDCLLDYGPACDANKIPAGGSTRNTPRPQLGQTPYGAEGVYSCTEPGTVAMTFDDGPYIYTDGVLDLFKSYGFKATFFITGININKGAIDDPSLPWAAVIKRMIAEGHQVASHTWSHQDLSKVTQKQRIDQLVKNEMAFTNILGKFPTYMRPPYSSCDQPSGCWKDMTDLGYVVSYFSLDTDDYDNESPNLIQNAKNNVAKVVNVSNPATDDFLSISHDIHQQTAQNLTGYMLDLLSKKGYRGVTMGECLGETEDSWYRTPTARVATSSVSGGKPTGSASSTSAAPVASPTAASPDGSCGGSSGFTCLGFIDDTGAPGNCCSQNGYCGSSTDYCGTGCQSVFGICGTSPSSSKAPSSGPAASSSAARSSSAPAVSSSAIRSSSTSATPTLATSIRASATPVKPSSTVPTSTAKPKPTPTANVSKNGRCGSYNGDQTCAGYGRSNCCSMLGRCGNDVLACGIGCQTKFGTGCWW